MIRYLFHEEISDELFRKGFNEENNDAYLEKICKDKRFVIFEDEDFFYQDKHENGIIEDYPEIAEVITNNRGSLKDYIRLTYDDKEIEILSSNFNFHINGIELIEEMNFILNQYDEEELFNSLKEKLDEIFKESKESLISLYTKNIINELIQYTKEKDLNINWNLLMDEAI